MDPLEAQKTQSRALNWVLARHNTLPRLPGALVFSIGLESFLDSAVDLVFFGVCLCHKSTKSKPMQKAFF